MGTRVRAGDRETQGDNEPKRETVNDEKKKLRETERETEDLESKILQGQAMEQGNKQREKSTVAGREWGLCVCAHVSM